MAIELSCIGCGHGMSVPDKRAGRSIRCPRCSAPLTVPGVAVERPVVSSAPPPRKSEVGPSGTHAGSPPPSRSSDPIFVPYGEAAASSPVFVPYDEPQPISSHPVGWSRPSAPSGFAAGPWAQPVTMMTSAGGASPEGAAAVAMGKVPWASTLNGLRLMEIGSVLIGTGLLILVVPAVEVVSRFMSGPAKGPGSLNGLISIGGLVLIPGGVLLCLGGILCATAPETGRIRSAGIATAILVVSVFLFLAAEWQMQGGADDVTHLSTVVALQTLRHLVFGLMYAAMFLHLSACTRVFRPASIGPRFVAGALLGGGLHAVLAFLSLMQYTAVLGIRPGQVTKLQEFHMYLKWYVFLNVGGNIVMMVIYAMTAGGTRKLMNAELNPDSQPTMPAYPVSPAGEPVMPPSPFFQPGAPSPFFHPGAVPPQQQPYQPPPRNP